MNDRLQAAFRRPRQAGIAMIVVMVAVAVAVVLAAGFVTRQSTASSVTSNIQSHAQARLIAESAMELAIGYISNSDNWRYEMAEGNWVVNQSYAGGTYTIRATDGDETGGDGDLTDDVADQVTLTVTGRFGGASHTLTNVVTPTVSGGKKIILICSDSENPEATDATRKGLMEEFGWAVTMLADDDVNSKFDEEAADAKAVYISATANANQIATKVTATPLGVVNEQKDLVDNLGFASSSGQRREDAVDIIDNTHEITSVFPIGELTICTSSQSLLRFNGSLSDDLYDLATRPGVDSQKMLGALDAGKLRHDGDTSPGRRVQLPWAYSSSFDPNTLNDNGKTIMERSLLWATKPMVPPPPVLLYGFDEVSGSTETDGSGNNHTGTLTNGPTFAPGAGTISGAMNFDGVNDYVIADDSTLLNPRNAISFSAWVKSDNWAGGNPRILQKGNSDNQYRFLSEWGSFKFHLSGVGELTHAYPDTASWKHLAATWDGATMRLYYDGVEVASKSATGTIDVTNHPLYVGTKHSTAPSGDHFKGLMDDVRIYNVALNSAEVKWLYDQGKPEDTGPVPQLIALYDFQETVYDPQLIHHWKLDEPDSSAMPGLSLTEKFYATGPWAVVDSYSSVNGAYNAEAASDKVGLTVNSNSSSVIELTQSSVLQGDAYVGPSANVSSAISTASGADITGLRDRLDQTVDMPSLSSPSGHPFDQYAEGNYTVSGSTTINSDRHFRKLQLQGNARLTISGDVTILCDDDFTVGSSAQLIIADGATLNLYLKKSASIDGKVNVANAYSPARCNIFMLGDGYDFNVADSAKVYALVQNPRGYLNVTNQGDFYGGYIGRRASINDSRIHIDLDTTISGAMSGSAVDDAGDADGSFNGPTRGLDGIDYRAVRFDGSNDYVMIPHSDSMLLNAGAVSFWFKPSSTSGTRGLLCKDAAYFGDGGHLRIYTSGKSLRAQIQSTTATYTAQTGNLINSGNWYNVVVSFGPTGLNLFVNGSLVASSACTSGLGVSGGGAGNTEPIILGADASSASAGTGLPLTNFYSGLMDDVRIYNQPIDQTQAADIYNRRELSPTSGPGYTVVDSAGYLDPLNLYVEDTSKINWIDSGGLELTSETKIISPGAATKLFDVLSATDEMTLEVVFTPENDSQDGPAAIVSYADSASNRNFTAGQSGRAFDWRLRTSTSGNDGSPAVTTSEVLSAGISQHLIIAYDKSEIRIYRNGNLDKTVVRSGTLDAFDQTMRLVFGNELTDNRPWLGRLTRVAIYDRGVNNLQAEDLFNGDPPGDYSDQKDVAFGVHWIEKP
ncbi:hypothetical protein HED60_08610 [Planctomycetales bacterium ZRK34]|nr:hypothetical protein HED60_08610 [Planctomycetales bacterium ZRK34]